MKSMTSALEVNSRRTTEGLRIEIIGTLNTTTAPAFEQALAEGVQATINATTAVSLSVDCRRLDFIDNVGLGLLLAARRRLAAVEYFLNVILTPG